MPNVDGDIILKAALNTDGIKNSLSKLQKTVSKGLKNAIRIGFGVRSVFALIRRLRKALIEGFGDLAQVSEPFNKAMTSLINALANLKSSFSAAFAPIIQLVSPALTGFINLIGDAVDKVGMLIAALSGQTTYIKAIPIQQDYASSVADTAKSANSASKSLGKTNKSAKELKRTLAGFDDLEILKGPDNDDDSSSTTGGKSTTKGGGFTREALPLMESFNVLATKLKEAWAKADFTEIGRIVGDKLNEALQGINWVKIRQTLNRIAKSVATFLNGFLETPGLFTTIGTTVGNAINTALSTLLIFVQHFHWESLGTAIRDGVVAALGTVSWDTIYLLAKSFATGIATTMNNALGNAELWTALATTISNWLNTVVLALNSFVSSVEWESIAAGIATGLNNAVQKFNWGMLSDTLIRIANSAFRTLKTFVKTFDFTAIGSAVGKAISNSINGINWRVGGNSVASVINGLFNALKGFVTSVDFKGVGSAIIDAIVGFFEDLDWATFGDTFSAVLTGLLEFIKGAMEKIPWSEIPGYIVTSISTFLSNFDWEGLINATIGLLKGAIDGLIEMIEGTEEEDGEESPIVSALGKLKEAISGIADIDFESIATGLGELVTALAPAVKGFAAGFIEAITALVDIGVEFFKELGPFLHDIADAISELPPETLEAIGKALGIIAGALVSINVVQGAAIVLSSLVSPLMRIASWAGQAATAIGTTLTGGAAAGTSTGLVGAISALGVALAGFSGALIGLELGKIDVSSTEEEMRGMYTTIEELYTVMQSVNSEYGLSTQELADLSVALAGASSEHSDMAGAYDLISTRLQKAGIDMDEFGASLHATAVEAGVSDEALANIDGYIASIGTSAANAKPDVESVATSVDTMADSSETADTNTTSLSDAITALSGLGLTEILKIALIKGAIGLLGASGKLSAEQVTDLTDTLDDYDSTNAEATIGAVTTALEDAGVSAEDFTSAVGSIDSNVQADLEDALKSIQTTAPEFKTEAQSVGKNLVEGVTTGEESGSASLQDTSGKVIKGAIHSMESAAEINSPSKVTQRIGSYLMQGLKNGLVLGRGQLTTVITATMKIMTNKIQSSKDSFSSAGQQIASALTTGFSSGLSYLSSLAGITSVNIANTFNGINWWSVGSNIAIGIYNGLAYYSSSLYALTSNLALGMLNSAKSVLGIASPSKVFRDQIGKMIPEGIAVGITDETGATIDALDNVSDAMLAKMQNFNALANSAVSPIATGRVAPYSFRQSNTDTTNPISELVSELSGMMSNTVTRDDLLEVMTTMFERYMNINFYLGDEQVARHANRGNLLLGRRYSIIK